MPQATNIAVYDGASTPVLHTLVPIGSSRDKNTTTTEWREEVAGLPLSAQVRCTQSLTRLKSGVYRAETIVVIPVMEAVNGTNSSGYTAAPKVAYEDKVSVVMYSSERSSVDNRRRIKQTVANLLQNFSHAQGVTVAGPCDDLYARLVTQL